MRNFITGKWREFLLAKRINPNPNHCDICKCRLPPHTKLCEKCATYYKGHIFIKTTIGDRAKAEMELKKRRKDNESMST